MDQSSSGGVFRDQPNQLLDVLLDVQFLEEGEVWKIERNVDLECVFTPDWIPHGPSVLGELEVFRYVGARLFLQRSPGDGSQLFEVLVHLVLESEDLVHPFVLKWQFGNRKL